MNKLRKQLSSAKGFTLVELLIVIALIGILSVAVLATINPVEQTNKARDAAFKNDAAELESAIERFYAAKNFFPWNAENVTGVGKTFAADNTINVMTGQGTYAGVCSLTTTVAGCGDAVADNGDLIVSDELKKTFGSKVMFHSNVTGKDKMYVVRDGANTSVCFIPKASTNQKIASQLSCLSSLVDGAVVIRLKAGATGCNVPVSSSAAWAGDSILASEAVFICLPQ